MDNAYEKYLELKEKVQMMEEDAEIFASTLGQFRTQGASDLCNVAALRFANYLDSVKGQLRDLMENATDDIF